MPHQFERDSNGMRLATSAIFGRTFSPVRQRMDHDKNITIDLQKTSKDIKIDLQKIERRQIEDQPSECASH
jgi:hypothetical protein